MFNWSKLLWTSYYGYNKIMNDKDELKRKSVRSMFSLMWGSQKYERAFKVIFMLLSCEHQRPRQSQNMTS